MFSSGVSSFQAWPRKLVEYPTALFADANVTMKCRRLHNCRV